MKLEKRGRYTYLVIGKTAVKCASAKAGEILLDALKASQRTSSYKPGAHPTFATLPWFNWTRGYGKPPPDTGHECDHHIDESGPEVFVKDDKGSWVQMTGLAHDKPLREKPPTPPLEAAKHLVASLEQEAARLKELGEARSVWTIRELGLSELDIDKLRDHPEREPMARSFGRPEIKPWKPWKEWCAYSELGPINSEIDGETQFRFSIENTRRLFRYDEVQKIIEGTRLATYSLILTRGWYRTCFMDRAERVLGMAQWGNPTASTIVQQTQALCGFPGLWFDLDCAAMVWQPSNGLSEVGLLVMEAFSGKPEKPRFYPLSGRRGGYPADEWPRRWEGHGLIVL